jgi:hypothetical protein
MTKPRSPKVFSRRTLTRLERRKSGEFRPATKVELRRMGFSLGSERLVEKSAKLVSQNTPSISRREYLKKRGFETAGVRLSLEKIAERRRTGEIAYRTASAAEQASKQRETRAASPLSRPRYARRRRSRPLPCVRETSGEGGHLPTTSLKPRAK